MAGVTFFAARRIVTLSAAQREIMARNGLAESDVNYVRAGGTANRYRELLAGRHEATLLRTPFDLLAQNQGFRQLAPAEVLGPYQGTAGIARRSWAQSHEAALVGFIRGYRAAVAWLYDRANRDVVEALLVANSRDMTPALVNLDFKVTPTPQLLRKDPDLGLDAARQFEVPMPLASITHDLVQPLIGDGRD